MVRLVVQLIRCVTVCTTLFKDYYNMKNKIEVEAIAIRLEAITTSNKWFVPSF